MWPSANEAATMYAIQAFQAPGFVSTGIGDHTMTAVMAAPPSTEVVDDRLYEVVYGEKKEKTVGTRQNMIASRLVRMIGRFDPEERIGSPVLENLFVLDAANDLQRRPDLAFVSRQRWPGLPPDSNAWDVVPDWMVEVISSSNSADEVIDKVDEYFRAGSAVGVGDLPQRTTRLRLHVAHGRDGPRGHRRIDGRSGVAVVSLPGPYAL